MEGQQSAVTHEITVRAAADADLAASIVAVSDDRHMHQQPIAIDEDGRIVGFESIRIVRNDPFPTRAEFDAVLVRLLAAEAEIAMLKMGRGPEAEGVI